METHTLHKRKLHLLCGHGNMAANLEKLNSGTGLNALWAGDFLLETAGLEDAWINWGEIDAWAAVEDLNPGSYQKILLPRNIDKHLKGSGRWLADDGGGWARLLKEASLRWQDLSPEEKKSWERVGNILKITLETLSSAVQAEEKQRGTIIKIGCQEFTVSPAGDSVLWAGQGHFELNSEFKVPECFQNLMDILNYSGTKLGDSIVMEIFQEEDSSVWEFRFSNAPITATQIAPDVITANETNIEDFTNFPKKRGEEK